MQHNRRVYHSNWQIVVVGHSDNVPRMSPKRISNVITNRPGALKAQSTLKSPIRNIILEQSNSNGVISIAMCPNINQSTLKVACIHN